MGQSVTVSAHDVQHPSRGMDRGSTPDVAAQPLPCGAKEMPRGAWNTRGLGTRRIQLPMQPRTYQTSRAVRVIKGTGLKPPTSQTLAQLAKGPYGDAEVEDARQAGQVGYLGRVLVQTTLPHSRPQEATWERSNGRFTLTLMANPRVGLPYGVIPRLVLVWLSTEAQRLGSREIVLGHSLSEFLEQLQLGRTGGKKGDIPRLQNQLDRLFSTAIFARWDNDDVGHHRGAGMVVADDHELFWDPKRPEQGALWQSSVVLSERFFREVTEHGIPLDLAVVRAVRRSPLALDAYAWLTYRLPFLKRAETVPWASLAAQFGGEYKLVRQFRAKFEVALRAVVQHYPDAHVEPTSAGLVLKPSKSSVPRLR